MELSSLKKGPWIGVLAGLVYGLFGRLMFSLSPDSDALGLTFVTMSYAFVFLVPLGIGALTVLFAPPDSRRSWPFRIFMPWLSCLLMMLAALALAWEGTICLIMAGPIILVLGSLGGILAGVIMKGGVHRGTLFASFLLLPFLAAPLEQRLPDATAFREVTTEIVIRADAEAVWKEIVRVPEIRPGERRSSFFHLIGIPKPIEATLSKEGIGGIREARFEKGIVFHEQVTEWEPKRALGFEIRVDPASIPPDALDEHVRVGDRHFDVVHGRFEITPTPEGVVLHLSSRHRLSTPFNWYSSLWSDWVMEDIQETICEVIKARSESS